MDLFRIKTLLLLLLFYATRSRGAFVDPVEPRTSQRSKTDSQTRLPCRYQVGPDENVVQVTWYKELPDRPRDQMITAHYSHGHSESLPYAGRVRFESSVPTENAALLIPSTEESDEGVYICHISTYPNGNFERIIALTVWSLPIWSVEPVVMREGQPFGLAASCRAVGRPAPTLAWDTPLAGKVQNRSGENGAVSTLFSVHPLRSMNGKRLDCLMWYPGLQQPERRTNTLEVQYPPEVKITPGSGHWFVGMEKAELVCHARGQPQVSSVTWKWNDRALPEGVVVTENKLLFRRALRLNDSGVYECAALNAVGAGRTEYEFTVAERSFRLADITSDSRLLILIGAGAGLLLLLMVLVIVFVNRHHKNKHKKLEMELSEKTEEINSLSRQTSLRRLNSVSSDPRSQPEDYALLRVDSRMKQSQMSLERPLYRGSQATLAGRWAPPGDVVVDALGRPVVWCEREMDPELERGRRAESCLKSSNMSLDSGLPSSLVPLKPPQEDVLVACRDGELPHLRQAPEPWSPPALGPADDDSDSGSYQLSEALHTHFYYSNGQLRPRPHSNAILLHPSRPGSVIRNHHV
ncbi:nectin-4 [Eucyclogobius newberryi]|uniref:nectin-4 n=1 Tax=Eucyclogobius newberryi TaxID=166745 RepID=UPI003B5AA451